MNNVNINVKNADSEYISVITCTKRLNYMDNVFNNFNRQIYKKKQLIIILNNNQMDINEWQNAAKPFDNIKIYQLDESISLGNCLNFGVLQTDYAFISKFDDDDFYGPKYLSDSIKVFKYAKAGVIGKAASYVYFEENSILALRNSEKENCYVTHLDGPTLIIKRDVFNHLKFRDITRGEDKNFCRDCIDLGINLYSTNRFHHVYIRHASVQEHTWTIGNKELLNKCKIIERDVKDYKKYTIKKPKDQIIDWYKILKNKVKNYIGVINEKPEK